MHFIHAKKKTPTDTNHDKHCKVFTCVVVYMTVHIVF